MHTHLKLQNGCLIPTLGLGTWESPKGEVKAAVESAILEADYRHIDCAAVYGNEREVGEALNTVFKNGISREELFITSKLWNTNHKPDDVETACRNTLSDLQLDYLDLYLVHWGLAFKHGDIPHPVGKDGKAILENVSIQETWQAMEQLVKKGLVKSIGVANFTTMMLVDLCSYATIQPMMNQIELHPYNSQADLVSFCGQRNIAVTAYSPLGRQGVANADGLKLAVDPVIQNIAQKYGKSEAQILLNWAINRGTVAIPKSVNSARIKENKAIFDFGLTETEMNQINGLNKNHRFVDPSSFWGVPYFI